MYGLKLGVEPVMWVEDGMAARAVGGLHSRVQNVDGLTMWLPLLLCLRGCYLRSQDRVATHSQSGMERAKRIDMGRVG